MRLNVNILFQTCGRIFHTLGRMFALHDIYKTCDRMFEMFSRMANTWDRIFQPAAACLNHRICGRTFKYATTLI